MAIVDTDEQNEFYEAAENLGQGEALSLIALSGCGKTTSMAGLARRMFLKNKKGMVLTFNRQNAQDAARKIGIFDCRGMTVSKLGWEVMTNLGWARKGAELWPKHIHQAGHIRRLDFPKVRGMNDSRIATAGIRTMRKFCESDALDFTPEHAKNALIDMFGDPDFMVPGPRKEEAREILEKMTIPLMTLGRMIYHHNISEERPTLDQYVKELHLKPHLIATAFRGLDYIGVDEAQDSNPVTMAIVKASGLPSFIIGDPYQQLYSWRGAVNAFDHIDGKRLYLSQSFRFGENIAQVGRHALAMRPDGGPDATLTGVGGRNLKVDPKVSKIAIICRTNSGVIDESLSLIRKGKTVRINNAETLLTELKSAEALSCGEMTKVTSDLFRGYESWDEAKTAADDGETAIARYVKIVEDNQTGKIYDLIQRQKADEQRGVVAEFAAMTGHSAKGLEFIGVKIGGDWKDSVDMRKRFEMSRDQSESARVAALEEYNAFYVAVTRARAALAGEDRVMFPKPKVRAPEPEHAPAGPC